VVAVTEDRGDDLGVPYLLNLQVDPAFCMSDPWEPNPTFTQAPFIFPHPWWNMVVCPDDEDWYETAQWAGPLLQIWAFFDPDEGDINLSLHDGTTGELLVESTGSTGEEYVEWLVEDGPPYSFRVWHEQDRGRYFGNVYDLLIQQTYPDGCTADAFEFNDGQGWAYPIGTGSYPGLHACSTDADWFKIVASAGDVLELDLSFDASEGDVSLALYSSSGTPLGTLTTAPGEASIDHTLPSAADVFLEVVLQSDTGSTLGSAYSLQIAGQSPVCYPDTWEPNDQQVQASGLGLDPYLGMTLCTSDDWYDRLVVQGDTIAVDLIHDPSEGALALRLRDESGGLLDESITGTGAESVSWTTNMTRFVFVEVEMLGDLGVQPGLLYDMTVTVTQ
jgi:hypothetical protein